MTLIKLVVSMKTYKVIQRHCVEDVWIMDAEDKETAMLQANDTNPDNTKTIPYSSKMILLEVKELK